MKYEPGPWYVFVLVFSGVYRSGPNAGDSFSKGAYARGGGRILTSRSALEAQDYANRARGRYYVREVKARPAGSILLGDWLASCQAEGRAV